MTLETFIARAQTLGMEARRVTDMAACRAPVADIVGDGPALPQRSANSSAHHAASSIIRR